MSSEGNEVESVEMGSPSSGSASTSSQLNGGRPSDPIVLSSDSASLPSPSAAAPAPNNGVAASSSTLPAEQRVNALLPSEPQPTLENGGSSSNKRSAEDELEEESPRPSKRQKRPPQGTDDTLPGSGERKPDTFMLNLPGDRVRWFKLPPERPFATERLKLLTLARIARPAEEDPQFVRVNWNDIQSAEGKLNLSRVVRKQKMVVVNGYHDEYDICPWEELAKLGGPTEVVATEYPFQSSGKPETDSLATLRDIYKMGAETSPQWGSTTIPIKIPRPPLLEFLADDYLSWLSDTQQSSHPQHTRPESFNAFNWHMIMQRDMYTGLRQDITGRIMTCFQRCGHRLFFYCRPSASWTDQGQDHADCIYRMEDMEHMGSWFSIVIRPGEMFIQPPGPVHIMFTPENNIIRVSQYLTFFDLPQYEKWRRQQAFVDSWTPEFQGMSALRTLYRMAMTLPILPPENDVPMSCFIPLARMVLRPQEYLPRPVGEEENKTQFEFLSVMMDPSYVAPPESGVEVEPEVLQEEAADFRLASALVRRRLAVTGINEMDL